MGFFMATIVARASSYQARVRRKGIAVSQSFLSKEAAEKWSRKVEHMIDEGRYLPSRPTYELTLKQALLDFATEVESTGRKGWSQERTKARVLANSIVVDKPLSSITSADIIRIRQDRLKVAASGTVRLDLAVLSALIVRLA